MNHRFLSVLGLVFCSFSAALAAETKPQLRGVLDTGLSRQFLLSSEAGTQERWVGVGGTYDGWKVDAWKGDKETLVLKGADGAELDISLTHAAIGVADAAPAKATLADAQAVMDKMHFGQMMGAVIEQQKAAAAKMTRQMLAKMKPDMSPQDVEKAVAQQKKVMDAIWGSIDMNELQQQMAQIYSNVFTADELHGMSEFYTTPAGQAALQKAPEVQQQTMQVIMPKMMEAMQKLPQAPKAGT
jgi:hypothetical protein